MNLEEQNIAGGKKVVIVGGGLAGLAAAAGLVRRGLQVELLEAKQSLGGRAGSYRDAESGELIDHCQHVALGGCTNFLDLCKRTGCSNLLERHRRLYFFSAAGQRSDFAAAGWLPAPLHLLPTLLRMKHLSWRDIFCIGRAMQTMMRTPAHDSQSIQAWLEQQRQTPAAIERFWKVVLVSALADSLDHISYSGARQVFVKGFLAHPSAADVLIPQASLGELYDQRMASWLREQGATIRCGEAVKQISRSSNQQLLVQTTTRELTADAVISAVPWQHVREMLAPELRAALPQLNHLNEFSSSPIASVHLWTDRPIMDLPHAVLIERLSQWVFARKNFSSGEFNYQVVISGEHSLAGQPKQTIIDEVWRDLQAVFPAARNARLLRARLITQREAVFREEVDGNALAQLSATSSLPQLTFAGDWLNDGWYATMEGAVRSGYRAAERIVEQLLGEKVTILQPDLPRSWLARWLIK
ncbi:hydroxysqualene dehydroxylase HpnE [Anatilimnocola floriformis]|uniref:hydroxysqualene dehydroxylase HpnE n=1 Tax=Anatilimnocola floriformis TaxID=2948575 RepID=UPI0020C431B4|nr:hydroxysqualene dehydroxylase HpnE [Anatilimnocola floriformis]